MTSAKRPRPAPEFAGKEFSDTEEVVDMARQVAEALQHMPWKRARRVPIDVLGLQPTGSPRSDPWTPQVSHGVPRNKKIHGSEDPGYSRVAIRRRRRGAGHLFHRNRNWENLRCRHLVFHPLLLASFAVFIKT